MMWAVVLDEARGVFHYGPFDDEQSADEFARFLTAEVDPARVVRLRPPVAELLGYWRGRQVAP